MKRTVLLFVAMALAAAGAAVVVSAAQRALAARRALVSGLSATLGRARSLDVAAQQVRAETGLARPAAELLGEAMDHARTGREKELLGQSLACLTDGGCADAAAPIARAQEENGKPVDALWASVDEAEANFRRVMPVGFALAILGVLVAAFAPRATSPAPEAPAATSAPPSVAAPSDTRAMEDMLRARLEALYQARNQLGENARFAAFGELAAALSHGLKTPFAGVLASVQLAQLKLGESNPAKAELEEIVRIIEGLTEQVQRFLRASGKVGPQRERVTCGEVLESIASAYAAEASRRGVNFSVSSGAGAVDVDRSLLDMALRNLVENALAAVKSGQSVWLSCGESAPPSRVGLEATAPPDGARYLEFVVDDEGPGLPAAARRSEPGATTRAHGSGLGLAIARRVAERHDGALLLEDRPGGGTRVRLVLPAAAGGVS
jgi:signal transduction histidine kinase